MLNIRWFKTCEDLEKLTGKPYDELWAAGFNLDDWDFGIRVDRPLHRAPTEVELRDGEYFDPDDMAVDYDSEGSWLFERMQDWLCGCSYVKLGRWHYYLCHHA